jgi:hypothetical protein
MHVGIPFLSIPVYYAVKIPEIHFLKYFSPEYSVPPPLKLHASVDGKYFNLSS